MCSYHRPCELTTVTQGLLTAHEAETLIAL
jgi:hypothetical protein